MSPFEKIHFIFLPAHVSIGIGPPLPFQAADDFSLSPYKSPYKLGFPYEEHS